MAAPRRFAFRGMGSPCELQVYAGPAAAAAAADLAIAEVRRLEARYSRYRDDSITAAINRAAAAGSAIRVDPETAALLEYADTCYRESDGLFDITSGVLRRVWRFDSGQLPEPAAVTALLDRVGWWRLEWRRPWLRFSVPGMELDFGGIGKEYAADRVAACCAGAGIHHGLINLGGDVRVLGPRPGGAPWRLGIRHPRHPERLLGGVLLTGGGLASSGDYVRCLDIDGQRYSHLLDPRTGWPCHGLVAVSVIADTCLVAGSICTIGMLRGSGGAAWLAGLGVSHLWVDGNGKQGGSGSLGALLERGR
jgi:thiamine biosynthesis lipoprotein